MKSFIRSSFLLWPLIKISYSKNMENKIDTIHFKALKLYMIAHKTDFFESY